MKHTIKSADELKAKTFKAAIKYFRKPISENTKYAVLSEVQKELSDAYLMGLLTEEPTDLRVASINCIGSIILFHGPFHLEEWIDNVWKGNTMNTDAKESTTLYKIRRIDTGEILPEPYVYTHLSGAELGIYEIIRLHKMLDTKPPKLEVVLTQGMSHE